MKKDIEWLKKEIEEYLEYEGVRDARIALESVLGYIDQLDEPEVKQLDKKIKELDSYNDELIRDNNQLRNHLDEPQRPVIPQFVADFIRETKPNNSLRLAFEYIAQQKIDNYDDGLAFWIEEGNSELFARAWIDGYKVEEEKVYHVVNKKNYFMLRKYDGLVDIFHVSPSMSRDEYGKDTRFMLTEQEIKDYDERYIPFMVPVDEVNND